TTREWVRKAEADYLAARKLARGSVPLHDQSCFLFQQPTEKYLKALLEELGLPPLQNGNVPGPFLPTYSPIPLQIIPPPVVAQPLRAEEVGGLGLRDQLKGDPQQVRFAQAFAHDVAVHRPAAHLSQGDNVEPREDLLAGMVGQGAEQPRPVFQRVL